MVAHRWRAHCSANCRVKALTVAGKSASAYRVEGTVTMGPAKEGKQPIHIEWLVRDPQGKKLGTVSQRNEIPEGPWTARGVRRRSRLPGPPHREFSSSCRKRRLTKG